MNVAHPKPRAEEAYLIRPAVRREIPEINTLVAAAIGAYGGTVPDKVLQLYTKRSLDIEARWEKGEVLVATQYGRVVGTVTFHEEARYAGFPPGWASFGTLAVHPGCQRRGIASRLVRHCVARAVPVASVIGIHTASFMPGAMKLYEGMGFVRAEEHDRLASSFVTLGPDEGDLHVMGYRLDLDSALSG